MEVSWLFSFCFKEIYSLNSIYLFFQICNFCSIYGTKFFVIVQEKMPGGIIYWLDVDSDHYRGTLD